MKESDNQCRTLQVTMPNLSHTPADIEFNITLKVSQGMMSKKKTILKDVSGLFKSGELTAIMGPSGAGKTSLLNALTGFATHGVTGTIRSGDKLCELGDKNSTAALKEYRKKTCYILQDDRLNPLFTVEEHMWFAADLKLGNCLTEKLKLSVIDGILDTLGLAHTKNTKSSRLSGGQRKRLSIALELIDNPPVVFLDEPTTGLDSLTTTQCVEMLKSLAQGGRTIVCTIHQPTATIYSMFDQVYLLAEGMCIYDGSSGDTVPYLASAGLQCPKYHNPADYILEVASGDYGNFNEILAEKREQAEKVAPVVNTNETKVQSLSCGKIDIILNPPHELYKFFILFTRCIIQLHRDWSVTYLKLLLHVLIGIFVGLLFQDAGSDGSKTINNMGYLLASMTYLTYTSLMPAVLRFPTELAVLKKENFNNWYSLKTYYIAVLITSIPLQICYSFVYTAPSYYLTGQPQELYRFAMFALVLAIVTVLADAIGNVIGSCTDPVNGTFFGAVLTAAMILYSGYVVLFSDMSATMRAVSHISFMKYGFESMVLSVYAYGRPPLPCPETKDYCPIRHPTELMKIFSFDKDNYWSDIAVLFVANIIIRIIAYLTLKRTIKSTVRA
ncbi:ATP-binding cassette sub-family G member 4-like [Achroia grisella]|uniref:ATP-binding cassette sub-family G member 4-like n=1 Tax=Achroia grisella TaxID=688607 RepID=UPI0027D30265|nr:ATP-binding cassette sub-family G member 4-like [Achroia grisella]